MTQEIEWAYPSTGGGDVDGLNNPKIQHFTGNYNYFLARETIQNAIDAKNPALSVPVKVIFKLEYLEQKDLPGHQQLLEVIGEAKKIWKHHQETIDFLNVADSCLKKKKIPILRISDYNTTGLSGKDTDLQGGWFNLVRSTGASSKSTGEGGSFGIGKGAPFAASDLRVVYYATKNLEGESVFQGKAELVSFMKNRDMKRGVGSYGIAQNSIRDRSKIPPQFLRQEEGTDIIIAGYRITADWAEDLLKSVLRNFWYAIHCNDLEVEVEGSNINSKNLPDYLVRYFAQEPFKDYIKPSGNPLQYYLSVIKGQELSSGNKLKHLGECKFYFLEIEEHMNYVAMLRKSHMVIYTQRFTFPGNFAGVFICDDKTGNQELRRMEPPAHDNWDPKRHNERGTAIIDELTKFIRNCLNKMKQNQSYGVLEIPELQKYLPFDKGDESGNGTGGSEYTGKEAQTETSHLIQKSESFQKTAHISPYRVAIINESNVTTPPFFPEKKPKRTKERSPNERLKLKTRSFLLGRTGNILKYRVLVSSQKSMECNLRFLGVGEEGNEALKIVSFKDSSDSNYSFSDNVVHQIKLSQQDSQHYDLEIESAIKLSLKIEATEANEL